MPARTLSSAVGAALLIVACGSSSSSSSPPDGAGDGGAPEPGHDAGTTNRDGAVPPGTDGSVPPTADGATPVNKDGGVVTPSHDVTITVEPDGSGDAAALLSAITAATTAVHVEMYLLTNSKYIDELITLHGKGVDVKVILNETFPTGTATQDTNASTYTQLQQAGVGVVWAPTTTGFDSYTHEKTVIIDPATSHAEAWIMTMNLDTDAPKYNREYLALDTSTADVAEAEAIFEADYASTDISPSGNLVVAPSPQNNAQSSLLALITSAKTSIDVEAEEYDASGIEAAIANELEAKARAGVTVHMVLEDSTVASQSAAVSALQSAGGQVVGYVYSATSLDIHAKAIVVDGTEAFVGSENLSGGSLGYNRELGVIFDTPSEVAKVATTIASDFASGAAYQ